MPAFIIPLLLQIAMHLPELIQKAEEAFSGKPGSGQAKKDLVLQSAGSALDIYKTVSGQPMAADHVQAIMGTVSALTDATVTAFNSYELFKKSKAAQTV